MGNKRLRPWLEYHINKGTFKGLRWIDKSQKIYRIPWKDNKRKLFKNVGDTEIIRAWAISSGKHKRGDPEDLPKWKEQLRNSFNRIKDFNELPHLNNTSDLEDPFKVYMLLDNVKTRISLDKEFKPTNAKLSNMTFNKTISPAPSACSSSLESLPLPLEFNLDGFDSMAETCTVDESHLQDLCVPTPNNVPNFLNDESISFYSDFTGLEGNTSSNGDTCSLTKDVCISYREINEKACTIDTKLVDYATPDQGILEDTANSFSEDGIIYVNDIPRSIDIGAPLPDTETNFSNCATESVMSGKNNPLLQIQLFYGEQCVLEESIAMEDYGARLFFGDLSHHIKTEYIFGNGEIFGPMNLKQICIPDINIFGKELFVTEKQKRKINKVQQHMNRGLILRMTDTKINVERLCKTSVFVYNQERISKKLSRTNTTSTDIKSDIFDLHIFNHQLIAHIEKDPMPSPTVVISFGGEYKPNTIGENIMFAKVTHLGAKNTLLEAINNAPDNNEQLFSNSIPEDNLAGIFSDKLSLKL